MAAQRVQCSVCEKPYMHSFPNQVVCPSCGCAEYSVQAAPRTETQDRRDRQLTEQRGPRLLTEDEPAPPRNWNG